MEIQTDMFVCYWRLIGSCYERFDQSQLSVGATDQIDVGYIQYKRLFLHYYRYNWQKHYFSVDIKWESSLSEEKHTNYFFLPEDDYS